MEKQTVSQKRNPETEAEIRLRLFAYLKGLEDGLFIGLIGYTREIGKKGLLPEQKTDEAIKAILDDHGFGDLAYPEIAEKTAEFYGDTRNRGIELFYSVPLIVKRLKGVIDDAQMESELKEFRFRFPAQGEIEQ
jgi:hypothetical protein